MCSGCGETGRGAGGQRVVGGASSDAGHLRVSPPFGAAAGTPEEGTRPLLRGVVNRLDETIAKRNLASLDVRFHRFVCMEL